MNTSSKVQVKKLIDTGSTGNNSLLLENDFQPSGGLSSNRARNNFSAYGKFGRNRIRMSSEELVI